MYHIFSMKTVSSSAFTETAKMTSLNGTLGVNDAIVFRKLQPISESLQTTIPHDHAMALTEYVLWEVLKTIRSYKCYRVIDLSLLINEITGKIQAYFVGFNQMITVVPSFSRLFCDCVCLFIYLFIFAFFYTWNCWMEGRFPELIKNLFN